MNELFVKRTKLMNEVEFRLKVVVLLVILRTYWVMCYNHELCLFSDTCHFQKLSEENAAPTEFDFNWNSVPVTIGQYWYTNVIQIFLKCTFSNLLKNIFSLCISLCNRLHCWQYGNPLDNKRKFGSHYCHAKS